jgi:serine/threonine protein kinase
MFSLQILTKQLTGLQSCLKVDDFDITEKPIQPIVRDKRYLSQEALEDSVYSKEADIFSFGLILLELTTGKIAKEMFSDNFESLYAIKQGQLLEGTIFPDLFDIIQRCLKR